MNPALPDTAPHHVPSTYPISCIEDNLKDLDTASLSHLTPLLLSGLSYLQGYVGFWGIAARTSSCRDTTRCIDWLLVPQGAVRALHFYENNRVKS